MGGRKRCPGPARFGGTAVQRLAGALFMAEEDVEHRS
eukprot:SAG31_NODE_4699_length_3025_cov_10.720096_1_plen_37_part_00